MRPRGGVPLDRLVTDDDAGVRTDVAVAAWLGEARARAQERIAAGDVTVDGVPAAKSQRLRAGQRVVVAAPPSSPAAPAPPSVPVRYADEHLLIVAKPPGMVVHGGAGVTGPTLVDALRAMGEPLAATGDQDRPGIVHRLDRGTSGLLVVARTDEAYRGLVGLLSRHDVERVYWALVEGVPNPPRATIDAPIARSARRRTRFAVGSGGRRAVSHYDVREAFGRAAQVAVRLGTGRTHQVRVHLSSVGHPVVGDVAYGASPALGAELGLDRPALHAARLAFRHPVTGMAVACDEPPADDLLAAHAALRRADVGDRRHRS